MAPARREPLRRPCRSMRLPLTITTTSPLPSGIVGSVLPKAADSRGHRRRGAVYVLEPAPERLPDGLKSEHTVSSRGTPATNANSPYSITITAQDSAGTTSAPTTLTLSVRAAAPDLLLSAGSLSLTRWTEATPLPVSQSVSITSSDVKQILDFSVQVSQVNSGPAWFTASVGTANPATPATLTVALTSQALALSASPNPYMGTIAITCASNSELRERRGSQTVTVALTVTTTPGVLNVTTRPAVVFRRFFDGGRFEPGRWWSRIRRRVTRVRFPLAREASWCNGG